MFRKLDVANVAAKYFHLASDIPFFSSLDDEIFPKVERLRRRTDPDTGKMTTEKIVTRAFEPLVGAIAIGRCSQEHVPPDRSEFFFRTCAGRWVYGDYLPTNPGAVFPCAPFQPDDEVLVAAMACSHDCVCDVPAMKTLFLEGELSGNVENLYLMMIYDLDNDVLMRRLDEMGVLFLYDDTGSVAKDDFEPYFPIRSIHTYHEKSSGGPLKVDLTVPLPLFERFRPIDVTAARALNAIYKEFPSLDCPAFDSLPLIDRWEAIEDALTFNENILTIEEIKQRREEAKLKREEENRRKSEERRKRVEQTLKNRGEGTLPHASPLNAENLMKEHDLNAKRRLARYCRHEHIRALISVFEYANPLADAGLFLCSTNMLDHQQALKFWSDRLSDYPICLGYDDYTILKNDEDKAEFSRQLQDVGRAFGIDEKLAGTARFSYNRRRSKTLASLARERQERLDAGNVPQDRKTRYWLEDSGQVEALENLGDIPTSNSADEDNVSPLENKDEHWKSQERNCYDGNS